MKRILSIALALLMTVSLTACGGEKESQNNKPNNETIAEITDDTTTTQPETPSEEVTVPEESPDETTPKEEESEEIEYTEENKQKYYEDYFLNNKFEFYGETFAYSKQMSSVAFKKGVDGTVAARVDHLTQHVEIYIDANKQQYIKSGDKEYKFTESDEHKNLIEEYNLNKIEVIAPKIDVENIKTIEYVMSEYERDASILTMNDGVELCVYVDINNHKIVRIDELKKTNEMPSITTTLILSNPKTALDIPVENIESDPAVRDELLNLFFDILS